MVLQVYHPGFFGGTWTFSPDPIDFRAYCLSNIYEDDNAFEVPDDGRRDRRERSRRGGQLALALPLSA